MLWFYLFWDINFHGISEEKKQFQGYVNLSRIRIILSDQNVTRNCALKQFLSSGWINNKIRENSLSTNIDKITLLIHDTLFRIHSRGDGVINDKMKQCIFFFGLHCERGWYSLYRHKWDLRSQVNAQFVDVKTNSENVRRILI